MALKIMFRGDDRHPLADNIFANGFYKRNLAIPAPVYMPNILAHRAGDLQSESGISLSSRFTGAALFPLKFEGWEPRPLTFIYVVCVEASQLLNTHARQVRDALGNIVDGQWRNPHAEANRAWSLDAPMWPLFAHEAAADSVPAGHIISAVECTRTWSGWTWRNGGIYRLGAVFHNPGCTAPAQQVQMGRTFLQNEVDAHQQGNLPNGVGGYTLAHLD